MRTRRSALAIVLLVAAAGAAGAQSNSAEPKPKKSRFEPVTPEQTEAAKRRTARLFEADAPLEFTLVADYKEAFKNRDTLNVKRSKATLVVRNDSGQTVSIPIEIAPRGHWRLMARNCPFPPIRLIFPDSGLKGTPFAGQEALKLGTHCRPGDKDYEEIPVREHAIYRAYTFFTPFSFNSRLARVTYVDSRDTAKKDVKLALLIESEEDVGKRNGGRISELRGAVFDDVDPPQLALLSVFQYLIGNTDFSLYSLHNIRLLQSPNTMIVTIPYDFDWSGAAYTRYSKPDYRLGIKTTQERLYRGPCLTPETLQPVLEQFAGKRDAIRALYGALPLDKGYAKWVLDYYEEFFKMAADKNRARRDLVDGCVGKPSVDAGGAPGGAPLRDVGR